MDGLGGRRDGRFERLLCTYFSLTLSVCFFFLQLAHLHTPFAPPSTKMLTPPLLLLLPPNPDTTAAHPSPRLPLVSAPIPLQTNVMHVYLCEREPVVSVV